MRFVDSVGSFRRCKWLVSIDNQPSSCTVYHSCCLALRVGLDLYNGSVRDNKKAGVLEPAMSKTKSLKFATEAAITILRIDDMIKLAPEPKDQGEPL